MSSKSDPNSSSDGADSLTVASSMSNSTVYAGAGADNISVNSHMIAGQLFAGRAPTRYGWWFSWWRHLSVSMEQTIFTAVDANAASLFGGTENDTFNFTGDVKDSSLVGGFGVDSLVVMPLVISFVEPLFMVELL